MGQERTALPRLTSFSTRNAPRGDEIDYWRQALREAYVSVRTDPVGAEFGGEIRLGQYADFRLSTKRARAEEVRRSRSDIAQDDDEQNYLYFLFQTRGTLLVEQAGRAAVASPGSLVIYNSASPFALRTRGYYEQVVLELPADDAFARVGVSRADYLLAKTFDCDGAMGSVTAFFTSLARSQAGDPVGAHRLEPQASALGASLIDLLSPARPRADAPDGLRRSEALTHMRTHLADLTSMLSASQTPSTSHVEPSSASSKEPASRSWVIYPHCASKELGWRSAPNPTSRSPPSRLRQDSPGRCSSIEPSARQWG